MTKKGFTLLEMMIALMALSLLLLLSIQFHRLLYHAVERNDGISQYDVFTIQFQNEMMIAYDFENNGSSFCYKKNEQEFCIKEDNNRLVKTPGFEILLFDVEEITFRDTSEAIELSGYYQKVWFSKVYEKIKE